MDHDRFVIKAFRQIEHRRRQDTDVVLAFADRTGIPVCLEGSGAHKMLSHTEGYRSSVEE